VYIVDIFSPVITNASRSALASGVVSCSFKCSIVKLGVKNLSLIQRPQLTVARCCSSSSCLRISKSCSSAVNVPHQQLQSLSSYFSYDIVSEIDKDKVTALVLLDLSADFDIRDHEILLSRNRRWCL